jgi:hypothetical protein
VKGNPDVLNNPKASKTGRRSQLTVVPVKKNWKCHHNHEGDNLGWTARTRTGDSNGTDPQGSRGQQHDRCTTDNLPSRTSRPEENQPICARSR